MVSIKDIDDLQSGSLSLNDFGIKLANAARNAGCQLFSEYPGALIPGPLDIFAVGVWSGFCKGSSSPLPTEPVPPFTGGQCPGHRYNVHIDVIHPPFGVTPMDTTVYGPISAITANTGFDSTGFALGFNIDAYDYTGTATVFHTALGGGTPATGIEGIAVTPLDGVPDTCGDPPVQYPTATIPTGGNVFTITAAIPGITTQPEYFATVNVPPTTGSGSESATLPSIDISPSVLSPSLNIPITLNADLGGVNFNFNGDSTNAGDNAKKAAIQTSPPAKPSDSSLTQDVRAPGDNYRLGIANLAYVQIDITEFPSKGKTQFGTGESPNVYFAGWFEYLLGGQTLQREHIWFNGQIFINQNKADGYTYVLTNQTAGYAIEYISNAE